MYGALWRILPGPWWLRVVFLLILAAVVVWVCFTWAFPALSQYLELNNNTVG